MTHCFFSSLLKLNNFSGHGASPDPMYTAKDLGPTVVLLQHQQVSVERTPTTHEPQL